jgi:hypothetical protein
MKPRGIRKPAIKPDVGPRTMFELAQADLEKDTAVNPAALSVHVTGSTEIPQVPPQPPGSPWAEQPVPDEEPLLFSG